MYTRERELVRRRGTDGQRRAVVQIKYDGEVFTSNLDSDRIGYIILVENSRAESKQQNTSLTEW